MAWQSFVVHVIVLFNVVIALVAVNTSAVTANSG